MKFAQASGPMFIGFFPVEHSLALPTLSHTFNRLVAMELLLQIRRPFASRITWLALLTLLLCTEQSCKKDESLTPGGNASDGIAISDANELSKVMIIPGATLEKGTPPPVTNTTDTPRLSTSTPDVTAISGQDGTFSFNYSNVVGSITVIYIQFEGADSYFKIPLSGNSGTSGTIRIPMRIPENYTARPTGKSFFRFCCYAASAQGTRQTRLCNNTFSSNLPPKPGKGTATIGGTSFDANAVCDMDFAPFGRGYGILLGNDKAVVLYNMRQGSISIGNFETLAENSNGTPTAPFALYFDGTTIYASVSGTANATTKAVATSILFRELYGSRQVSISATGNCQ